jgi:hypothetical protein
MRRSKAQACPYGATTPSCVSYDDPSDRVNRTPVAIGINGVLGAGLRIRLARGGSRLRLLGELGYRGELLYSSVSDQSNDSGKPHQTDFGGADLFHGGRFSLIGEL